MIISCHRLIKAESSHTIGGRVDRPHQRCRMDKTLIYASQFQTPRGLRFWGGKRKQETEFHFMYQVLSPAGSLRSFNVYGHSPQFWVFSSLRVIYGNWTAAQNQMYNGDSIFAPDRMTKKKKKNQKTLKQAVARVQFHGGQWTDPGNPNPVWPDWNCQPTHG